MVELITDGSMDYEEKKERQNESNPTLSPLVARGRVEPPTFGLWIQRSNHLSYRAIRFWERKLTNIDDIHQKDFLILCYSKKG